MQFIPNSSTYRRGLATSLFLSTTLLYGCGPGADGSSVADAQNLVEIPDNAGALPVVSPEQVIDADVVPAVEPSVTPVLPTEPVAGENPDTPSRPLITQRPITILPEPVVSEPVDSPAPALPVPEPVVEPTPEPVVEPVVEPTPEPVVEPVVEPTPEPVVVPVVEPTPEPVVEPVAEPTPEPVVEPVAEPTPEPVVEPVAEPTPEPVVEPVAEPTPEPVVEPVAEPTPEPVVEPVAEPTPEPVVEPVAEPTPEPVVEPEPEVVDAFEFETFKATEVGETEIKVEFSLNRYATGQIRFGTAADEMVNTNGGEESFNYALHRQPIKYLSPATTYYLQAFSKDVDGNEAVSEIIQVTTKEATTPVVVPKPVEYQPTVGGWPSNADESLPMSGIFYGMTHGGLQTGNTTLAIEHSFRFRAEKTGAIAAVRWENRLLNQSNIDNRTSPDFKNCKNNNLPPNVCSYTLGNSYHVGNGGQIVATIHPDNGNGLPNESVELGKVEKVFIPSKHPSGAWVSQYMVSPVSVVAGGLYHIKLKNLAPPQQPLYRNSNSAAWAKNPNTGAISLNGVWHGDYVGPDSVKWGPYYGKKGQGALYRNDVNGRWYENHQTFGWIEILYSDGVWAGDVFAGYDNIRHQKAEVWYAKQEGYKLIGGNNRARQSFVVRDANRDINGMWLSFGHEPDSNLTPITVQLKDASGRVLASGSIAASSAAKQRTRDGIANGNINSINANTWGYTDLTATRLQVGQRYYLELSASAGAGFHINSFFPVQNNNRNEWRDAQAEFNSGSGWGLFDRGNGRTHRDLPIVFTLVGMPKQLP